MFPYKDEISTKGLPIINVFIIIVNVYVFVHQTFFLSSEVFPLAWTWGSIPFELTHLEDLPPPAQVPVPLTILTAMFLHGGLLHLLGNVLFLWVFGNNVEGRLGHVRYLFFYLFCGAAASLFHIFTHVDSKIPMIGASGAIAGVMGAYLFLFPKARVKTLLILGIFIRVVRVPAFILLGYWILIQVLSGFAENNVAEGGGIAWFSHIGGFVTGFFTIIAIKRRR